MIIDETLVSPMCRYKWPNLCYIWKHDRVKHEKLIGIGWGEFDDAVDQSLGWSLEPNPRVSYVHIG